MIQLESNLGGKLLEAAANPDLRAIETVKEAARMGAHVEELRRSRAETRSGLRRGVTSNCATSSSKHRCCSRRARSAAAPPRTAGLLACPRTATRTLGAVETVRSARPPRRVMDQKEAALLLLE